MLSDSPMGRSEDSPAAVRLQAPEPYALGWMFWLTRKRLSGS